MTYICRHRHTFGLVGHWNMAQCKTRRTPCRSWEGAELAAQFAFAGRCVAPVVASQRARHSRGVEGESVCSTGQGAPSLRLAGTRACFPCALCSEAHCPTRQALIGGQTLTCLCLHPRLLSSTSGCFLRSDVSKIAGTLGRSRPSQSAGLFSAANRSGNGVGFSPFQFPARGC